MSFPYRFPDGHFGRLIIALEQLERVNFMLSVDKGTNPEEQYKKIIDDCDNQLLCVSDSYLGYFSNTSEVSKYLFGMSDEQFSEPKSYNILKWETSNIANLNWDMFLLAFYLFVFSNNDFSSFYWRQLQQIFSIIENDSSLFKKVVFGKVKNFEENLSFFWDKVYEELCKKVLRMCSDKTCWTAFEGLKAIEETFKTVGKTRHYQYEKMFCMLMDDIAISKLRNYDRSKISYLTVEALDIDNVFFYNEYFKLKCVDSKTKQEVYEMAFERFVWAADSLRDNNQNYISADKLYNKALEYANADQKLLIDLRRKEIVPYIQKQQENIRKEEQRKKNIKKIDNVTFAIVFITGLVFIVFVILTLISLIFSLHNLLNVSWVGVVISIAVAVISILIGKILDPEIRFF